MPLLSTELSVTICRETQAHKCTDRHRVGGSVGNEELGLLTKNEKFFQKCLAGPRRLTCPKCLSKSGTGSRRCWFDALAASAQEHSLVVTLNTAPSPPINAQTVYSWESGNHNSVIFLIHNVLI